METESGLRLANLFYAFYYTNWLERREYYQSKNKITRINTNSSTVQNIVCYPNNWAIRYSAFYDSMLTYMATGKNKHDDAQDCITGVIENNKEFFVL